MKALIVVDVQNDFVPGGALAVPAGDEVIPVINRFMDQVDLVVATQDWHPADHGSFASNRPGAAIGDVVDLNGLSQILWPDHCVQDTPGAAFVDGLRTDRFDAVFRKGADPSVDSYSGFYDNGRRKATGLGAYVKRRGVTRVYVSGLATDYCVKWTALDAIDEGFETVLLCDGVRGVELQAGDCEAAIRAMAEAGVGLLEGDLAARR